MDSEPNGETRSPCPELLLNNEVPSHFRALEIKHCIESVEVDICILDAQIVRLQRLTAQLLTQRTELHDFAHGHRGTISAVRRLPNEILTEIFLCCTDPEPPEWPCSSYETLLPVMQVCGRWRAAGLASPQLWNFFDICGHRNERPQLREEICLRLQRSGQMPISISLASCGWQRNCTPKALIFFSTRRHGGMMSHWTSTMLI